jgi:hypothetical protein
MDDIQNSSYSNRIVNVDRTLIVTAPCDLIIRCLLIWSWNRVAGDSVDNHRVETVRSPVTPRPYISQDFVVFHARRIEPERPPVFRPYIGISIHAVDYICPRRMPRRGRRRGRTRRSMRSMRLGPRRYRTRRRPGTVPRGPMILRRAGRSVWRHNITSFTMIYASLY